jgi:hypothetical protein
LQKIALYSHPIAMDRLSSLDVASEAGYFPVHPKILSIQDMDTVIQARVAVTAAVQYTTSYFFTDDDVVFFGQLPKAKANITAENLASAMEPVSDHIISTPSPIFPGTTSGQSLLITERMNTTSNDRCCRYMNFSRTMTF